MLAGFYKGFTIEKSVGNNAFSYRDRQEKRIFVAPFIDGTPEDLAAGGQTVFSEIRDGQEIRCPGLKEFVHWEQPGRHVCIFDNHNHAFFIWCAALKAGWMKRGVTLVHIDQHKDLREPPEQFPIEVDEKIDLDKAFFYTNEVLNVGNFIKPALAAGIFSDAEIIDSEEAFGKDIAGEFVLDLDMDIFSRDMDYIPEETKIRKIRILMARTPLVTVATSPYFMEQDKAISLIRKIFQ